MKDRALVILLVANIILTILILGRVRILGTDLDDVYSKIENLSREVHDIDREIGDISR